MNRSLALTSAPLALLAALALAPSVARAAAPDWVNRKGHSSYPKEQFYLGVGSAALSGQEKNDVETAEANARRDILAQIQVTVKSESESYVEEQTKNGQTYDKSRFTERTVSSVAGTLEGVRIVESHVDKDTKTRWALAVLDRRAAANGVRSGIEAANEKIRAAFGKADDAKTGDAALRALFEVFSVADANDGNAVLYRALTKTAADALGASDVREKVASLTSGLTLSVKRGDGQVATSGQPLAEPVVFTLAASGVPYPNIPLTLALDGPGSVPPRLRTAAEGACEVRVSEVKSAGAPEQHVVAEVDWVQWMKDRGSKEPPERWGLTKISGRATYAFRTVATTRVLIAIDERIVWQNASKTEAPKSTIAEPRIAELLSAKGFDVRPSASLASLAGKDFASLTPKNFEKDAEVMITGALVSEFASRMCDECPTFHIAKGSLRAVDTRTGRVLAEIQEPGKKAVAESETYAGTDALKQAAKSSAPLIVEALVKALERK